MEPASNPRKQVLNLVGEDRDSPISIPSTRSICDPNKCGSERGHAEGVPIVFRRSSSS